MYLRDGTNYFSIYVYEDMKKGHKNIILILKLWL